jgi:heat shock protein HslJ
MRKFSALLITSAAVLALLAGGCAAAKAANNTMIPASTPALEGQSLAGTSWVLGSYGEPTNLTTALPQVKVTLNFNNDTTAISGNGGVNSYGGDCVRTDNQLTLSGIIHTAMASVDQAVNQQENTYFQLLGTAQSVNFSDGTLTINCEGGQVLVFTETTGNDSPSDSTTCLPPVVTVNTTGTMIPATPTA